MSMTFDLSPDLEREIRAALTGRLPPTADGSAESLRARDNFALAAIAELRPNTREEIMLAVLGFAANAHAHHYLYLAGQHRADITEVLRCRNKAIAKMREARKAFESLRLLRQARLPAQPVAPKRKPAPRQLPRRSATPLENVSDEELIQHLIEARARVVAPRTQAAAERAEPAPAKPAAPAFEWPPISPTIH